MTYYLNRERMRLVKTNDKGRVVKRKKYRFGDEVDVDTFIDDDRLDVLVEKGTLVESEDDLDRRAGWKQRVTGEFTPGQMAGQATTVANPSVGAAGASPDAPAATGDADTAPLDPEPNHLEAPQGGGVPTSTSDDGPKTEDGDDVELVDKYSDMDYKSLQDEAKERGLRYTGISAEDLKTNLREDDES